MGSITRPFQVDFGGNSSGLSTVGYRIEDSSTPPAVTVARTTTGVNNVGGGIYQATVTYDDTFSGSIVWDDGQGSPKYASETVAPYSYVGSSGGNAVQVPAYGSLGTVYCSDEDIAIRDSYDYATLCPKHQVMACAADGVFTSGSPWNLSSATTSFEAQGVTQYGVILLTKPLANFKAPGDLFAIDSVSGNQCALRRIGKPLGYGQPPAPSAGLTGVEFRVLTFAPQIESVSYEANKTWGIDDNIPGRYTSQMYDARELQQWTVLNVLKRAYSAAQHTKNDDYARKLLVTSSDFTDVHARLAVSWGTLQQGKPTTTTASSRVRR